MSNTKKAQGLLKSIFGMRCPRCRKARMFVTNNSYNFKHTLHMHEQCPECKQAFDMEPGFWWGTSYVSYALAVAFSAATFIAWLVLIGFSLNDNRIFWWIGVNAVLLIVIQPWTMRISRTIYIYFFIRYDKNYKTTVPKKFS